MSELKFIVIDNDLIINPVHLYWCGKENKTCINNLRYGIKFVLNKDTGRESIFKWFDSRMDRDKAFEQLSNNLSKMSIE